jgi:hypothetical protein
MLEIAFSDYGFKIEPIWMIAAFIKRIINPGRIYLYLKRRERTGLNGRDQQSFDRRERIPASLPQDLIPLLLEIGIYFAREVLNSWLLNYGGLSER